MADSRNRVQAGVPEGGQFATGARGENGDLVLTAPAEESREEALREVMFEGPGAQFDWSFTVVGYGTGADRATMRDIESVAQTLAESDLYDHIATKLSFEPDREGQPRAYQVGVFVTPEGDYLTTSFPADEFATDSTGEFAAMHYATVIDSHLGPLAERARQIRWTMDPGYYQADEFTDSLRRSFFPGAKIEQDGSTRSLRVPIEGGRSLLLVTDDGDLPDGSTPVQAVLYRGEEKLANARFNFPGISGYSAKTLSDKVAKTLPTWKGL